MLFEKHNQELNRRQLLRLLGVSAAAVILDAARPRRAWARQTQPPSNSRSFPFTTINHLSFQCGPDYKKVRDWYVELFTGRIAWDDDEQCEISFGDSER